jgi:hypothetical protein
MSPSGSLNRTLPAICEPSAGIWLGKSIERIVGGGKVGLGVDAGVEAGVGMSVGGAMDFGDCLGNGTIVPSGNVTAPFPLTYA